MRILFHVEGGPSIGMGHVMRSLVLASELQKRGSSIAGFLVNKDPKSEQTIESESYRVWRVSSQSPIDHLKTIIFSENVDVLISDRPEVERDRCRILKAHRPQLFHVALDCFDMENSDLDLIINLINHNPSHPRPVDDSVHYFEGSQYAIIRDSFDPLVKLPRRINEKGSEVLISFGGSDPGEKTRRVIQAVVRLQIADMTFHVVIGTNFRNREEIKKELQGSSSPWFLYDNIPDIEKLMFRCDFGFHGAGTTMLEMASLGTPAIVIPQSHYENHFAAYFAEKAAVINLGLDHTRLEEKIGQTIFSIRKDPERRREMSLELRKLVDGKGRHRIVDLVLHYYQVWKGGNG